MNTVKGRYIKNTSAEPLPILLAGKITPFDYLQPAQTYPLMIDGTAEHDNGNLFAVRSANLQKPVYILIGRRLDDGRLISYIDALSSGEKKREEISAERAKMPFTTWQYIKFLAVVAVAAYAYKAFKK